MMFAVLAEIEGAVDAAFVTEDRHEAHEVFAEAEKRERAVVDADPARLTLINCEATPQAFYDRLRESV